tara:strand:- start:439 stop:657 length:219 start_codon:yes stop_codon:yes gene_type:complete
MLHWKTREDMGDGFMFNRAEHSDVQYNSLLKIESHEKNIMRTKYLIRDWWSKEQLKELQDFINETIKERGDN